MDLTSSQAEAAAVTVARGSTFTKMDSTRKLFPVVPQNAPAFE